MDPNEEQKKIKDRECIHCRNFFDCHGKPRGVSCILFEERKEGETYGRTSYVRKINN